MSSLSWRSGRSFRASARRILGAIGSPPDLTFVRLRGNVGDHLIWAGSRRLLARLDYREVAAEDLGLARGHTALLAGSGGWCRPYHGIAQETLKELEVRFERVIVLPSSFDVSVPLVHDTLTATTALVFARERDSFQQVKDLCPTGLAHDTAFHYDYRAFRRRGAGKLVAYRTDREGVGFELPPGNVDISLTCSDLDEWLWIIARHEEVETDRAHVMIAAAMLGKRVFYRPSRYHKVPAIAEYSLSRFPVSRLS